MAFADGGGDHVGLQGHGFQVGCGAVADGDGGIFCSGISAMGLPTILLRPITTACLPRNSNPMLSKNFEFYLSFVQPVAHLKEIIFK
ncbi:hypothetical protein J2X15_001506 [Rhodoferax saidenbachensis]|uniref:Uncharacterized protein n=1 Tax=Rhodoferax saidenbachensis TaxID=1484693 RepID=A0ABU1ZLG8_9BURK|nr:hypothetical protein [Rhodoferax saidenbachensis]